MRPEQIAARFFGVNEDLLQVTRIKDGLTNESYRVSGGAENIVVRLSNADEASLQIDRSSEAAVLNLVEQAGIGATVLFNEPVSHVLITRELSGTNPAKEALADEANIARISALLRALHALQVPATVASMHLVKTLQAYWRMLGDWRDRETALLIAQESDGQLSRVLCHNDVHHLNLIDDGERLWLLDWEYAGVGDPYFDLASVCCYHDFNETQRLALLQNYSGAEVAVSDVVRLERMCWLFDYIKELWFAVRDIRCD